MMGVGVLLQALTSALDGDKWSASHPRYVLPPPPGKNQRYPLTKRLGGSDNRSEHPADEKNLPLQGIERLRLRPGRRQVTTATE